MRVFALMVAIVAAILLVGCQSGQPPVAPTPLPTTSLTVATNPVNAVMQLFVLDPSNNEQFMGSFQTPHTITAPNRYRMKFAADGYGERSVDFKLLAGTQASLPLDLTKPAPAAPTIRVELSTYQANPGQNVTVTVYTTGAYLAESVIEGYYKATTDSTWTFSFVPTRTSEIYFVARGLGGVAVASAVITVVPPSSTTCVRFVSNVPAQVEAKRILDDGSLQDFAWTDSPTPLDSTNLIDGGNWLFIFHSHTGGYEKFSIPVYIAPGSCPVISATLKPSSETPTPTIDLHVDPTTVCICETVKWSVHVENAEMVAVFADGKTYFGTGEISGEFKASKSTTVAVLAVNNGKYATETIGVTVTH